VSWRSREQQLDLGALGVFMPTTKTKTTKKTVNISFSHDPGLGYSWSSAEIGGGGYPSILEILGESDFLETLVKHLGKGCIPASYIKAAKRDEAARRLPIPEEVKAALRDGWPSKAKVRKS
jgi:hypothetical protein